jgi:uncharacterized protein
MKEIAVKIAQEMGLNPIHVQNTIKLLVEDECTIPFVTRYRKEVTGSMDEVAVRNVRERHLYLTELEATKERYLKVIELLCKADPSRAAELPALRAKFAACTSKQELEDLYLPFKPKRLTRAKVAREKGLAALLEHILRERASLSDLLAVAAPYVTPAESEIADDLRVKDAAEALQGAADILAENISETADYRHLVREFTVATGLLVATKVPTRSSESTRDSSAPKERKSKVDPSKYENYFDYREALKSAPSHRVMAIRRGEADKVLRTGIEVDNEQVVAQLAAQIIDKESTSASVRQWMLTIIADAYRRLLAPSIASEIRLQLKNRAEDDAIGIFAKNLENLLLQPPVPGKVVLGVDPGFQSGTKLAVVSPTGNYLNSQVIHPIFNKPDSPATQQAMKVLGALVTRYDVALVAIGNGTASKETDRFVISVLKDLQRPVKRIVVSEAGASVYSASDLAREEFPDLDATIRSAVSIARRVQDPLAELVKIDPRSIGVGQYQHDCTESKLNDSLKETVESCVNRVGVNINTASYKLLSYVSGIGAHLAKNIVTYRSSHGAFKSRDELTKVNGLGPKSFQQAAGFLRVPGSTNLLDNSAVHPESYSIVERMARDINVPLAQLIGSRETVETIALENYVSDTFGMPTLKDIVGELIKPGRDPRAEGSRLIFSDEVSAISDLSVGMKLKGTVSNVTNFGAFVDIGVHQDGLIHISELSNQFVDDPSRVIAVGDVLDVYVIGVDLQRNRISLSRKTGAKPAAGERRSGQPPRPEGRGQGRAEGNRAPAGASAGRQVVRSSPPTPRNPQQGGGARDARDRNRRPQATAEKFTMDDLLSKFNVRN